MRFGRGTALVVTPLVLLAGLAFGAARRQSRRAFALAPPSAPAPHHVRVALPRPAVTRLGDSPVAPTAPSDSPVGLVSRAMTDSVAGADSLEAVIIELRMGRLASRTVQAFRARTEALIPVTEVLQLGEVAYRLSPEGRLEAVINPGGHRPSGEDRKSTRLNSSHRCISYAVFCLKKK